MKTDINEVGKRRGNSSAKTHGGCFWRSLNVSGLPARIMKEIRTLKTDKAREIIIAIIKCLCIGTWNLQNCIITLPRWINKGCQLRYDDNVGYLKTFNCSCQENFYEIKYLKRNWSLSIHKPDHKSLLIATTHWCNKKFVVTIMLSNNRLIFHNELLVKISFVDIETGEGPYFSVKQGFSGRNRAIIEICIRIAITECNCATNVVSSNPKRTLTACIVRQFNLQQGMPCLCNVLLGSCIN